MKSMIGSEPPLHKRYDPNTALEHIRNRYKATKKSCELQVSLLQKDNRFIRKCEYLYSTDYRDWIILTIIFNCMMDRKLRSISGGFTPVYLKNNYDEILESLRTETYPVEVFLGELFEMQKQSHFTTVLITWGFQLRRSDYDPEVVERFLRKRMRHFENDLPHQNLFGNPLGDWPVI